jgi:hypothetical protein
MDFIAGNSNGCLDDDFLACYIILYSSSDATRVDARFIAGYLHFSRL